MPRVRKKPTLKWDDLPDIVGVNELMEVLGIGEPAVRDLFEEPNFPKIDGIGSTRKAEKEAVKLFLQGFKIKENPKTGLEYMILLELRKLNNNFEEMRIRTNE